MYLKPYKRPSDFLFNKKEKTPDSITGLSTITALGKLNKLQIHEGCTFLTEGITDFNKKEGWEVTSS